MPQKGFGTIAVVVVISLIVILTLFAKINVKNPNLTNTQGGSKATELALKVDYQNPFDQSTQYENPFSDYQNPIDQLIFEDQNAK